MGGDIIPFKLLGLEMSGVYSKLCSFLLGTDPCNSAVLHMGGQGLHSTQVHLDQKLGMDGKSDLVKSI